jgi:hypothetical protein
MKVKELAERIKGVNPEAEFQVFVLDYPQAFIFTHGGSSARTEETCIYWGPSVYVAQTDIKHHETGPGCDERQYTDPEKFDFKSLVGMKIDEVRENLDKNGFVDYTFTVNSAGSILEINYVTRGEWPRPWKLHTVRIEGK